MLRNIRLLYIHNFLTDFLPQWPYMVIYFQAVIGSYTIAMSVLATETVTSALMDIPTDIFSDRAGRRMTMMLGSLCGAISIALYASSHGLALFYLGAFFNGCSQCLFNGNNNALLYESLKSEGIEGRFHHYRAGTGSMYQLALCLSAFAAIFLSRYGLHFIFVVAVVPQVLGILVSLLFVEPRIHTGGKRTGFAILRHSLAEIGRNPRLMLLVLGKALNYGTGEAGFRFRVAFVNLLWPVWAVGLYRGINHALGFAGFQLAGRIIDRIKAAYIFVFRDVYWFFSGISAVILHNAISPVVLMTDSPLFGPGEVASDHLMQMEFTDEQRATMGSVASFASSIVFAVAALLIGAVSDRYGVTIGTGVTIGLSFLSLPVYVWLFRKDF